MSNGKFIGKNQATWHRVLASSFPDPDYDNRLSSGIMKKTSLNTKKRRVETYKAFMIGGRLGVGIEF